MKANELSCKDLMVGDWVFIKDYPIKALPQKVRPEHFVRSLVEFEPILLTPEILEKNGFVVESRDCHGEPLHYCVLVDGLWIDISGENFFEGKLEYVHQLQHTLRLCGIDKEIEL